MGEGRGSGADSQSVAIGGGVAVGLIVFLCIIGIPMFIAGGVLVAFFPSPDSLFTTGIALLVVASVLTVAGLVFIILLCAGVIGKSSKTKPMAITTTAVMVTGGPVQQAQQQHQYAVQYPDGSWGVQGYSQQGYNYQQGYSMQSGVPVQPPTYTAPPPVYSNSSQSPAPAPSDGQLYGAQEPKIS